MSKASDDSTLQVSDVKDASSADTTGAPSIVFKENVNITFENNASKKAGGAIHIDGGTGKIENNTGTCTFSNNNAKEQGGAISVTGNFDITGNAAVVFSGNKAQVVPAAAQDTRSAASQTVTTGTGGAIHCLAAPASGGSTNQPSTGSPSGSPAASPSSGSDSSPSGAAGAGTSGDSPASSDVAPSAYIALLANSPTAPVQKTLQSAPESAKDPCLTISGNISVTFTNNSSTVSGGAIHAKKLVLSSGGDISFSDNSSGKGGAIFIAEGGDISITAETGSITFQGNTVTAADTITLPSKTPGSNGSTSSALPQAALSLRASTASAQQTSADQKPTHNAIHLDSGAKISHLRAGTGQTIFFYDPITMAQATAVTPSPAPTPPTTSLIRAAAVAASTNAATPKTPIKINAADTSKTTVYDGTIVFSGEKLSSEEAANPLNAISVFNTGVSLEAGTLILKSGAGLVVDSFIQQEGSLIIMDGGTSIVTHDPTTSTSAPNAAPAPAAPAVALPVIKALTQSKNPKVISELVARSLMNFKQRRPSAAAPIVSNSQVTNPDGSIVINNLAVNLDSLGGGQVITLSATGNGNVSITGDLKFQDSSQNFYDNPMLNKNFSANLFSISAAGTGKVDTSGFNMIPQGSTSSNSGYQGKWEVKEVKDASGKVSFELQWISLGYTPSPNRRATLVPNSLWFAANDIQAIQQLVEASTRSEDFSKGIWISGLSNFFHRSSTKAQEGFRHRSFGYVIGASAQPITDKVVDVAFCQLFGKSKDYRFADAIEHIYALSIHTKREKLVHRYELSKKKGAILTKLPEQMPIILDSQLSYSFTRNSMTTKHTPDPSSRGKWNNHCVAGELGGYLPMIIENPIIDEFSPFTKLHIVFVQQQNFKETKGGDANRVFQSANFVNVSLPIGMKLEKTGKYGIYNANLIYQLDIYRDAPKSKVFLPSVDATWATEATNLARQGVIIDGSTHHHLTKSFELYSHGAFELRGSSRNYNFDLGGKYKF
ncbi:polymorphic outer membrane protein middle domain-containing protein [Chlamydia caviae]|uniref:polymorphic outer membrane protein middle domain-containing protein n=1 Tax=Chlamydia caviae TaxID=83557 RepID=UPI0002E2D380